MKYFLIFIAVTFFNLHASCQIKNKTVTENIKTFFVKNSPWDDKLYINKASKIIQFSNYQIPLDEVTLSYTFNSDIIPSQKHYVKFTCSNNNSCILNEEGLPSHTSTGTPFKTKDICYEFMDLIKELKDSLK